MADDKTKRCEQYRGRVSRMQDYEMECLAQKHAWRKTGGVRQRLRRHARRSKPIAQKHVVKRHRAILTCRYTTTGIVIRSRRSD